MKNIKNEYGLSLQGELNSDIWLENIRDPEKETYHIVQNGKVVNEAAYKIIAEKTMHGFTDISESYENYVKLFNVMGIHKLMSFKELMKEKNTGVTNLAKVSGVPRTTISGIANEATPFERVTVSNALAISKAMDMTIEEVYDKLYFERITHD